MKKSNISMFKPIAKKEYACDICCRIFLDYQGIGGHVCKPCETGMLDLLKTGKANTAEDVRAMWSDQIRSEFEAKNII